MCINDVHVTTAMLDPQIGEDMRNINISDSVSRRATSILNMFYLQFSYMTLA